jgi:GT2 family glycosyltransferase
LTIEDGRTPRVFIAIPSRDMTAGAICARLVLLLIDLARRPEDPIIDIVQGYPVDRVRNQICRRFLKSDADYLLMIDDDVVPPPTVLDMARHDKDVVAGLCYAFVPRLGYYSVAYPSGNYCGTPVERLGIGDQIEGRGLLEVELAGTACLLIHRRVLEALDPPYFRMLLDDDRLFIKDSEDFTFCRKVRVAGFSIWLDTDQPCSHYKALDMRASLRWAQEYAARQKLAGLDL